MSDGFDVQKFIESFPVLVRADGGCAKLRQLVSDLAMRGLLLTDSTDLGHSTDPPDRTGSASVDSYCSFPLPPSWVWSTLGAIASDIRYGYTASARAERTGVRLLRITDIQNDRVAWETVPGCEIDDDKMSSFLLHNGDLVIARTGGTIGKTYLVEKLNVQAVFASYLIRVAPLPDVWPSYLKVYTGSGLYWRQLYAGSAGTGQPNVNATTLRTLLVPVPPLAEQKRIVAKVDELMRLIDDLEARQAKKRDVQTRFRTSALDALTKAEGPEELAVAWKRAASNFEVLFDRADGVGEVRASVLEIAARGYLSSGAFTTGDTRSDGPFRVPAHWEWSTGDRVFSFVTSGSRGWANYYSDDGPVFLRIGNLDYARIELDLRQVQRVRPPPNAEGSRTRVQAGDVLISITGDTGMVGLVPHGFGEAYINQHIALCRPGASVTPEYVARILTAPSLLGRLQSAQRGIKNSLGLEDVRKLAIPVPPLDEQRLILARIADMMKLCDDLEAKLKAKEAIAGKLVEAVVRELVA